MVAMLTLQYYCPFVRDGENDAAQSVQSSLVSRVWAGAIRLLSGELSDERA